MDLSCTVHNYTLYYFSDHMISVDVILYCHKNSQNNYVISLAYRFLRLLTHHNQEFGRSVPDPFLRSKGWGLEMRLSALWHFKNDHGMFM